MFRLLFVAAFFTLSGVTSPAYACGAKTDCVIGDRTYRVRMPEGHDGKTLVGAIVFAHGYRGSAAGVMRNKAFARIASELGVAIIAANSAEGDWDIPGAPHKAPTNGAAEFDYFDDMIADASQKFPIDRNRLMLTGFSAGGMLVWNLACYRSGSFAAFVPMSGTFWDPTPATCDTPPTNIIHIHGDQDPTVPLSGRQILNAKQGNVEDTIEMYANYGDFGAPVNTSVMGMNCKNRSNGQGDLLSFCLFNGGHSFKVSYVKWAWQVFEEKGLLSP